MSSGEYKGEISKGSKINVDSKGGTKHHGRSQSSAVYNPNVVTKNPPRGLKKNISRNNSKEKIGGTQKDMALGSSPMANTSTIFYNPMPKTAKLVDTYSYFKYKGPSINYSFGRGKRFKRISGMGFMKNVPYYSVNSTLNSQKRGVSFGVGNRDAFKSRGSSPPPGSYELKSMFKNTKILNNCSWGKRTSNYSLMKKKQVPGPGAYELPSMFTDKYAKRYTIQGKILTVMNRSGTPGPIYQNYSNLCEPGKFKNISFGKGERSFLSNKMLKTESPGPGCYMLDTALDTNSPTGFSMIRPGTAAPGITTNNIMRPFTPGQTYTNLIGTTKDTSMDVSAQ